MKKNKIKKIILIIFLLLIWVIPSFFNRIRTETYFFVVAFIVGVAAVLFARKNTGALLGILLPAVLVSIYDYSYIFVYLPILLLIAAYRENIRHIKVVEKKGDGNLSNTYLTVSGLLFLGQVVYSLYKNSLIATVDKFNFKTAAYIVVWFVAFFSFLASLSFVKENIKALKLNARNAFNFSGIYVLSAAFSGLTAWFIYLTSENSGLQSIRTDCLPWYVFLLVIVFSDDPFLKIAVKKIENRIDIFVRDKEVEK